jgi:oligopeptide/dipeptide ABC transporter ATP-binding protein
LLLATAALAPVLLGHLATTPDTSALLQGCSGKHWLGTDNLGRDVLARVLVATRLSVSLALLSTAIGAIGGILIGALPGVLGRRAGRLVSAGVNLAVAFPGLLLALFLSVVFGVGARGAILAVGLAMAPTFARLTQTLAASIAGKDYVAAAKLLGLSRNRILRRYVLPNIAEPLIVNVTLAAGSALLVFAGLSFLGLGVQPPSYDWGQMLGAGLVRIYSSPASALAPGVAVMFAGLAFNLAGERLAKAAGGQGTTRPRTEDPSFMRGHSASSTAADDTPLLEVEGLSVLFPSGDGWVTAVDDVSLSIRPGEVVGIVGESGSGKTLASLAIAGLVPHPGLLRARKLRFAGVDLTSHQSAATRRLLGTSMAMIFQDASTALNPALKLGRQLTEGVEVHQSIGRREATRIAAERLRSLRVSAAERRLRQYPHELSGGMRQRAMIAMGLMTRPQLLIADEPTTALDVTVQQQTLDILREAQRDTGAAILFISHDLAVVAQLCERVLVMYAGRIVEDLPVAKLRSQAAHPYTRALLATAPDLSRDRRTELATIPGRPPRPGTVTQGCPFAARCDFADGRSRTERPELVRHAPGHRVACWHPQDAPSAAAAALNGDVAS